MGKAYSMVTLAKDCRYLCPVLNEKYLICFCASCSLKLKQYNFCVMGWLTHIYACTTLSQTLFSLLLHSGFCKSSILSEIPDLTDWWPCIVRTHKLIRAGGYQWILHKSLYRGLDLWGTFWWGYSSIFKLHQILSGFYNSINT